MEPLLSFNADSKTIRKSAINSVLIQFLIKGKGIISLPILTSFLSPAELGMMNLINTFSGMLTPIFSLNLTDGPAVCFVQESSLPKIRKMYNTVANSVFLSSIVFSLILYLGLHFFFPTLKPYFIITNTLILSNVFYKVTSYMLAVFQQTTILLSNAVFRDFLFLLLLIPLLMAQFSFKAPILSIIATNFLAGFLMLRLTSRELPLDFSVDLGILRSFVRIALPLLPVFFFSWVIQSSDSFFLVYFFDYETVGKYSIAYNCASIVLSLTMALNFFWFPVSAKLWVEDFRRYATLFRQVFYLSVLLLLLLVCFFEINSLFFISLFARQSLYYEAHGILGTITFSYAIQVLITLITAPLYSNRNVQTIFSSYLLGGIANFTLNLYFIPHYGILGAAITTLLSYLIVLIVMMWKAKSIPDFHFLDSRLFFSVPPITLLWLALHHCQWSPGFKATIFGNLAILFLGIIVFHSLLTRKNFSKLFSCISKQDV